MFLSKSNVHAFLSSAGKIQWFSAAPSNICSKSGVMFLRLVIKKAMKIWTVGSRVIDFLSDSLLWLFIVDRNGYIVNCRIFYHSFHAVCTRWIMKDIGFSMSYMVCMRFTHSKDRQFLLRKPLMCNLISVVCWILRQLILWTFYTPESYIYPLGVGIYTPKTEYPWSYL